MSASPIYTYPIPLLADGITPATTSKTETSTIDDVREMYANLFGTPNDDVGKNTYYGKLKQVLGVLAGEGSNILGRIRIKDAYVVVDDLEATFQRLNSDAFYTAAQTFVSGGTELNPEYARIDENCREGFLAYRHYLKTIVATLERIYNYLEDGRKALEALEDEKDPDMAHALITRLEIDEDFIYEDFQSLCTYYIYNADTKQWEKVYLKLFGEDTEDTDEVWNPTKSMLGEYNDYKAKEELDDTHGGLDSLRETTIPCKDSSNDDARIQLTVFNSIPLLDRLRYIRYYYGLILENGIKMTHYSVFPSDPNTGYPCLPDVKSTKDTEDTRSLGALETFYVGYLIDRDGPINAVSSFFEVKTSALRNNLSLQSKKISALNVYLDFINQGMGVLNASQSSSKYKKDGENYFHRIPDGAIAALTYLCGQKMYNLFEASNGKKYLVLPSVRSSGYILISADNDGRNLLIGEDGTANNCRGDALKNGLAYDDGKKVYYLYGKWVYSDENRNGYFGVKNGDYYEPTPDVINDFELPTQIECNTVLPSSVKGYLDDEGHKAWDDVKIPSDDDDKKNAESDHTAMIKSWTDAFSNKTQYINTAIDTINTDVSVDRSKIDTLDSLTSTFRSRAQDAYLNTVANVRG